MTEFKNRPAEDQDGDPGCLFLLIILAFTIIITYYLTKK